MSKKLLAPLLLILLLIVLGYALTQKSRAPEAQFVTLSGQQLSMAQLRGKMVLVNFWATTCPGCIAEMPALIKTYQQYQPRGFEIVAVAMAYDPEAQVRNYATSHALPFPVTLDTQGTLARDFGDVKLTPTAVLIDQQGNIVRTVVGELDFASLHQQLDQALGRAG